MLLWGAVCLNRARTVLRGLYNHEFIENGMIYMITYTLLERDREKIEEGREKGRVEGSTEKALRVAEKMLSRGDKLEDIVDITELPMEKVLELKKKYQN